MTNPPAPDLDDDARARDEEVDLEARYGRSAEAGMPRWWWLGLVGLTIGVIVFWAMTSLSPTATVEFQTAGYVVEDANHARLDARVSVQPGTELACVVEAKSDREVNVGWKVITVPASTEAHQVITVPITTTRTASSVGIRECWIVGPDA